MIIVNKTEKTIAGAISGKAFSIPYNETIYKKLKKAEEDYNSAKDGEEAKKYVTTAIELTKLQFGELVAQENPFLMFNPVRQEYFLVTNKGTKEELVDDRAIPEALTTMINESFENGFNYMPLIKTWARFLTREKEYTLQDATLFSNYLSAKFVDTELITDLIEKEGFTYQAAVERALFQDIAITQEGLLATYKVVEEVKTKWILVFDDEGNPIVNEDGQPQKKQVLRDEYKKQYDIDPGTGETTITDNKPAYVEERMFAPAIEKNGENFFSGNKYGYIYKVGEAQYLPKINPTTNQPTVINYNNTFGGGGLYSGGQEYISRYKSSGDAVLVCFLDPANIISFQSDGSAIRSWELFPHNILEDEVELKGVYHSSKYAEESRKRTGDRIDDIIKKRQEELDKEKKSNTSLNNFNG